MRRCGWPLRRPRVCASRGAAWPGSAAHTRDIARFIALEGRVFVVLVSGVLAAADVPTDFPFYALIQETPDGFHNGGSCVVAPDGSGIVEPTPERDGLIVAEIDPSRVAAARRSLDVTGHDGRPDIFAITVDRRRQAAVTFRE